MSSDSKTAPVSSGMRWGGYIATALPVLMLLFSASGKFFKPEGMEANIEPLGWRMDQMTALGIVELACVIVYLIPQTAVFGAVLLTAYLGGATATHARIGDPFFFPIIVGLFVWLGIYLREPRLRSLLPLRN
ncbi:MAG: DoxX family protein [Pyrinomonadaceae bacterium]